MTHLLFVNLVMDGLGAMMLGNEPALPEYMDEAPRKRTDPLVQPFYDVSDRYYGNLVNGTQFILSDLRLDKKLFRD